MPGRWKTQSENCFPLGTKSINGRVYGGHDLFFFLFVSCIDLGCWNADVSKLQSEPMGFQMGPSLP